MTKAPIDLEKLKYLTDAYNFPTQRTGTFALSYKEAGDLCLKMVPDLIELLEESQTLLSEVYRVAERYETPLLPHTVGSIECFLDKLKKEGEK